MPENTAEGVTEYRVRVTPEQAAEWLENNCHNRNVRKNDLARYVHDMRIGDWAYTADPVRFDDNKQLLDGQHRLMAIVESGCAQEMLVVVGLDAGAQKYMDQGSKRTAGDQLKLQLKVKNGNVAAAIARVLMAYQDKQLIKSTRNYGNNEIVDFVADGRQELIEEAVLWYGGMRRFTKRCSGPAVGALGYVALREDRRWAGEFRAALVDGEGLVKGDAVLTLRNKLLARRRAAEVGELYQELWLYARVWRAWQARQPLRNLLMPAEGVTTDRLVKLLRIVD